MEYYTLEAIEKYKEKEPVIKKANKKKRIIIKTILIILCIFIFMQTPLYDLTVVSLRWGRPMIYKSHIRSGAIWDPRPRKYIFTSAFPLGGDPEYYFLIERKNQLFVTPFDIKDGYAYTHFAEDIREEVFDSVIEAGFEDAKINVCPPSFAASEIYYINTSKDEFLKECGDYTIRIYTYLEDDWTKEECEKRFKQIKSQWLSKYPEPSGFLIYAYINKNDYDKISSRRYEYEGESRIIIDDYNGEIEIDEQGIK